MSMLNICIPTRVPAESSQKSSLHLYCINKNRQVFSTNNMDLVQTNLFSSAILKIFNKCSDLLLCCLYCVCMAFVQILLLYYYKTGEGFN